MAAKSLSEPNERERKASIVDAAEPDLSMESVHLLGVRVHLLAADDVLAYIHRVVRSHSRAIVANVNVLAMNLACDFPWFRDFLRRADIVFFDGAGVKLGARMLGHRIPERITYADWMWQLAESSERNGLTMYFLGARPGVAGMAAARLRERFRDLQIVGVHHGYFDKTPGSADNEAVVQEINACRPDILVVGFGMPLQELWLQDNWPILDSRVALTGGAVFDYISGQLRRPPRWMSDHALEWLGRFIIEPRRLWKRYLIGNPVFFWRVIRERVRLMLLSQ